MLMYQRSGRWAEAFTYWIGANLMIARLYKVSFQWRKIKTLHLHALLVLNHSAGAEAMPNSFLIKEMVGCAVSVSPTFSARSFSVTVIPVFWCFFNFSLSPLNASYFYFSDVKCLPHAKAPTRYYLKVIKCFTYEGICSEMHLVPKSGNLLSPAK